MSYPLIQPYQAFTCSNVTLLITFAVVIAALQHHCVELRVLEQDQALLLSVGHAAHVLSHVRVLQRCWRGTALNHKMF